MIDEDIKKSIARSDEEKEAETKDEMIQLVVFELDDEEYAVDIRQLREIISLPDITPIPNAPNFIKGILNLRGKVVVVLDMEKRFNLVREHSVEPEHVVITQVDESYFGLLVDRVTEVLSVPKKSIQETPDLVTSKIKADYLEGVVVLEDKVIRTDLGKKQEESPSDSEDKKDENKDSNSRLLVMLDLNKMLKEKELLQLGETVAQTKTSSKGEK